MTRPGEKPTNITFYSFPNAGTKLVKLDDRSSAALLDGLLGIGMEAYRTDVGGGLYTITITKLEDEDAAL